MRLPVYRNSKGDLCIIGAENFLSTPGRECVEIWRLDETGKMLEPFYWVELRESLRFHMEMEVKIEGSVAERWVLRRD